MVPTVNSGSSDSTDVVISKREHTPLNHAAPSKEPKAPGWYKVVRIIALIIFLPYAVLAMFLGGFCDYGTFCEAANLVGWFVLVTGLPLFIGLIFLIKSAIFPLESICYLIGFSLFPLVYIAALLNLIDPETPVLWYSLFGFLLAGLIEIGALLWRVFRPSAKIAAVEKPVPAANINNSLQQSASASASSPNLTLSTKTITPLFQAVIDGDKAAIHAALAEDKEQINRPYAANGNTPLHVAVWNGHKDIVELLLVQDGIDTQAKNLAGKTALDLAVEKNFTDIIELLKFASR